MYIRLNIGATQVIYYNKHWHRVVFINIKFFQYISRFTKSMPLDFRRCKCGRGLIFSRLLSGLPEFVATMTFKCFGLVSFDHSKLWLQQIAYL